MSAAPSRSAGDAAPRGSLRRDAALVAAGQLAAVLSAFLLTLAGARLLSPDDFGALSWGLSWLAYLAVLAQFGLTSVATIALARTAPAAHARLLTSLLVALVLPVVAVVVLWQWAVGPLAAAAGTPPEAYRPLVLVVALWLPVAAAGPVLANALRARGRFGLALVFGEHVRRVVVLAVLLALVGAATAPPLRTALWWAVGAETVVYCAGVLLLARAAAGERADERPAGEWSSPRALLRAGSGFTLATLTSATLPMAGVWVLAVFSPVSEVAVFAVAVRVALLLAVPTAIGMRTLAPRIAAAAAEGRLGTLEAAVRRSASWSTLVAGLGVLVLAVTGQALLPAVFGSEYAAALAPTLVLGVGVLVNAWTGPCSVVLSHAGHQRVVAVSALVSSLAFFALSAWWAPPWGATGVAAAAAVAMSARNLHLARAAARALGIRTVALPARRR